MIIVSMEENMDTPKKNQQNSPSMYMLIGLPFTGKTTWAKSFLENNQDYVLIQQLGSKKLTEMVLKSSFGQKENIILDRMNLTSKYRKSIIDQAKSFGYNVKALYFSATKETLEKRHMEANFLSSPSYDKYGQFLEFFDLVEVNFPTMEEGFDEIDRIYTSTSDTDDSSSNTN